MCKNSLALLARRNFIHIEYLLTIWSVSDCVRSLIVCPPVISDVEGGDSVFVVVVVVAVDVLTINRHYKCDLY